MKTGELTPTEVGCSAMETGQPPRWRWPCCIDAVPSSRPGVIRVATADANGVETRSEVSTGSTGTGCAVRVQRSASDSPFRTCHRRFKVLAYHDAIQHDGPALELAELVHGALGPALVTVLFADDGSSGEAEVLLASRRMPLKILAAFMAEVMKEERRLQEAGPPQATSDDEH